MKIGDTIKCHDPDDMINTMMLLESEGIITEFIHTNRGKKVFWLEIVGFKNKKRK